MSEEKYVTRGVRLKCDKGSHSRRLNILEDKGVVIVTEDGYRHPMVSEDACGAGEGNNIAPYGVCTVLTQLSPAKDKDPNWKIYKKETEDGESTTTTVEGIVCCPIIEGQKWKGTKKDAFTLKGGKMALVTNQSYLKCTCGGVITLVDEDLTGLEYDGKKD